MVYYDHSVLYHTFGLSKNVFPPDEFVIPFPPYHISVKLYSPLYQICLFSVPPLKIHFPPTHRKNDRSLKCFSEHKDEIVTKRFVDIRALSIWVVLHEVASHCILRDWDPLPLSFGIYIAASSPLGCGSCCWRSPRGTGH